MSISTPIFLAYMGSSACSASINPAIPPIFCTSAIMCSVTVVLPLDSGPYISTILPLGIPPSPSAISRLNEPVGKVSTFIWAVGSPSFITAPFPYCFSIWLIAASNAFFFSSFSMSELSFSPRNKCLLLPHYKTSVRICQPLILISFLCFAYITHYTPLYVP